MKYIKLVIIILAPLLLFVGCQGPTFTEPSRPSVKKEVTIAENYSHQITVKNKTILVEVVDTDASRAQGLSKRLSLEDVNGMLFDFRNTNISRPSFWMKDMNFAIDIIWIANNRIVGITENIPPPKNNDVLSDALPTYPAPQDITHVLEVPSGWSKRYDIVIGDAVKL
ncbi:MAG TPA: DUF192 domain-containing protein [Candidatus Doudnabacteria bacterium]|mgnify:CR=1 FL=1|nr:DUF192 domain-containing protein [Candidatus Doudnabacteria bacterium]